jgi:hypothetical protein
VPRDGRAVRRPGRLITRHVADGRTVPVDDGVADLTFSYITLQHCQHDDALALDRARRCV